MAHPSPTAAQPSGRVREPPCPHSVYPGTSQKVSGSDRQNPLAFFQSLRVSLLCHEHIDEVIPEFNRCAEPIDEPAKLMLLFLFDPCLVESPLVHLSSPSYTLNQPWNGSRIAAGLTAPSARNLGTEAFGCACHKKVSVTDGRSTHTAYPEAPAPWQFLHSLRPSPGPKLNRIISSS